MSLEGAPLQYAVANLLQHFSEAVTDWTQVTHNEIRLTVKPAFWQEVARFLRDDPAWQMDYLADLTIWDTGIEFAAFLRLWSPAFNNNVIVLTTFSREEPRIASLTPVFAGANWHEREMYEMYGVIFEGHPSLKRLLLPEEWEGFPFRKDYVAEPSGNPLYGPQPVN